jgi:hypothetical protein
MTKKQSEKLEGWPSIGKLVHFKEKGGSERIKTGTIVDEVHVIVGDYKHLIQKIEADNPFWDGSRIGYRTCYYTYDAAGKHIKFGQYAQFLTQKEYKTLLSKAKAKGWPLFS